MWLLRGKVEEFSLYKITHTHTHTHTCALRYLMYKVHPKIYPAVCRVHQKEDQLLAERCRQLRGCLTPETLAIPNDYNCPYQQTLAKLNKLKEASSPLEKIHVLHGAVESVMEDAKTHFAKSLRIGGTRRMYNVHVICSTVYSNVM